MKKLYLLLIFLLLITFVSSACPTGSGYLGNKELNSCVRISQTCATCSYVNISSVVLSTSNDTLLSNVAMENFGNGEWIYQFCNTSNFGNYYITGKGNLDGVETNFKSCFDIGQNMEISEAIISVLFISILFLFLLIMFYFIIVLPATNERNERGIIIGIVQLKYVKIFLIAISYPLILIILNLMNGLAVNFSTLSIFSGTLGFIFESMISVSWMFVIIIIIWIIYLLIQDTNAKQYLRKIERFKV